MIRKFIVISIALLFCAGIILLVFPVSWFPSFYDVRLMGAADIVDAVIIIISPRIILSISRNAINIETKKYYARLFQFLLAFVFILGALGDLGLYQLYKVGFQYDKLIHFSNSLLGVLIGSIILYKLFQIRPLYAVIIAFAIIIIIGIGWEVFEQLSDFLFKTHIAGIYASDVSNDTKFDLIFDAIGALVGAIFFVFKSPFRKTDW